MQLIATGGIFLWIRLWRLSLLQTGQNVLGWGWWAGAERGWVISFWALGKGWVIQFSYPCTGVGHPVFLTGIGTHLTQLTTEATPSSCKGRKLFKLWLKKYTWLVYSKNGNFMYCKICTDATKSSRMSKESQDRNFQNTALFWYAGLQEHQMTNLCPHASTGHMFIDLGLTLLGLAVWVPGLTTAFF